jgi:predicted ATP-grasp superfamily ATP-dependent carboligase
VACLTQIARERDVDLVIPVTDAAIRPLSEARDRFDGVARLALPDHTALLATTDKSQTIALAQRLGVPVPRTALVRTAEEAAAAAPALGWPVVLKPQASYVYESDGTRDSLMVSYAEDQQQLMEQIRRLDGRCSVLLQEYYRGTGYGVELLLHKGRPLAAFEHRRLREVPITGGASALCESVPLDGRLLDFACRLLTELDWTGLAMVEFKIGVDGPKLMEINGRVWGSLPLAVSCGIDFPRRLAELYLYGPPQHSDVATRYRVGVRARNLELDLMWIDTVLRGEQPYPFLVGPRREQGVRAVVDLLNPTYKFDILSLKDPRPGLGQIAGLSSKVASKWWKR